jgi:hypothetical protein
MSDPEHFLSRWSRRKSEQKSEVKAEEKPVDADASAPKAPPAADPAPPDQASAAEPVFDPASLPSIDSIGPQTDIAAFLQPGVPTELRHAALRRAWSVDPAIRDFKGLQENDWDFNDPNGIPGFGPLSPDIDVKKMVSALFGETAPKDAAAADRQVAAITDVSRDSDDNGVAATAAVEPDGNGSTEPQNKNSDSESLPPRPRRPRGGALPDS